MDIQWTAVWHRGSKQASRVRLPALTLNSASYLVLWLLVSYLTSQCLSFLTSKTDIITVYTSDSCREDWNELVIIHRKKYISIIIIIIIHMLQEIIISWVAWKSHRLSTYMEFGGLDLGTERNIISGMGIRLSLEISGCMNFSSLATNLPSRQMVSPESDLLLLKLHLCWPPAVRKWNSILAGYFCCSQLAFCCVTWSKQRCPVVWGPPGLQQFT